MTLAVMGYHFQVITHKLLKAVDVAILPPVAENSLPAGDSGEPQ